MNGGSRLRYHLEMSHANGFDTRHAVLEVDVVHCHFDESGGHVKVGRVNIPLLLNQQLNGLVLKRVMDLAHINDILSEFGGNGNLLDEGIHNVFMLIPDEEL